MWKVLILLFEKLTCKHEWKVLKQYSFYGNDKEMPTYSIIDYTCTKCGKIIRRKS